MAAVVVAALATYVVLLSCRRRRLPRAAGWLAVRRRLPGLRGPVRPWCDRRAGDRGGPRAVAAPAGAARPLAGGAARSTRRRWARWRDGRTGSCRTTWAASSWSSPGCLRRLVRVALRGLGLVCAWPRPTATWAACAQSTSRTGPCRNGCAADVSQQFRRQLGRLSGRLHREGAWRLDIGLDAWRRLSAEPLAVPGWCEQGASSRPGRATR